MALYAAEPAFQPSLGERWSGTAAIRQHFAGALAKYRGDLHLHSQRSSASGDLAFDSGTYDETVRSVSGNGKPKSLKGGYLFVLQRAPGGDWKILEQIWTEAGPSKL
jgi:ketosteroid isomerase-like protein